jgi:hypothetical protein
MEDLPSELQTMITRWVTEFNRVDAIERINDFKRNYGDSMERIMENVKMNIPLYCFRILTTSKYLLCLSFFLPNCDPQKLDIRHRVPESCIHSYVRCSLTLRKFAYDSLQTTMYCRRPQIYLLHDEMTL